MKKCPTCDKTFDDNLRFCQTDGTPLVPVAETAAPDDPYKTMVASKEDMAAALPLDPFKTMVAGMPMKEEEEVLELPDAPEPPKPPPFSQEDIKTQIKTGDSSSLRDEPLPPPFGMPPPTYPPFNSPDDMDSISPSLPKFNEPNLNPPSFGDLALPEDSFSKKSSSPENESPFKPVNQSPFDKPISPPIPSPFDKSMPPGYHPPTTPPFGEPEKKFGTAEKEPVNQSPFDQSFGQQQSPLEPQANWSPPPAPDANWQNQEIGQNTPFQPPVAGSGQNQTLAIISLVCGILSLICCWSFLPGLAAVIMGFMAKGKAEQNPSEYGGRGLALGGIITGAISLLLGIGLVIMQIFFGVLGGILGNR